MNILWPDIHQDLTNSIALALNKLGHTLYLPNWEAVTTPPENQTQGTDFKWRVWREKEIRKFFNTPNVHNCKQEEVPKMDVVFCTTYENQWEIYEKVMPQTKAKIVHYSGNDYWEGAYPLDKLKNALCADFTGFATAYRHNKHYLNYRPWIDYDRFPFKKVTDSNIIGCYIGEYDKTFPNDYLSFVNAARNLPDYTFDLHMKSTREQVANSMQKIIGTLHIKRLEGYGFAIIQSMACGRPVFLPSQYSAKKSYLNWSIDGETALFFNDFNDLKLKLDKLRLDEYYRHELQKNCAEKIRELVNNEEQTEELGKFLENLV